MSEKKLRNIIRQEAFKIVKEDQELPVSYSDVPVEDLHPGVKEAIEDWKENTSDSYKKRVPLLYHLLKSGTPPYKMSKEDSEYVDQASGEQKCSNCEYLYQEVATGDYICSQIRGKVEPEGWCNQWHEVEDE